MSKWLIVYKDDEQEVIEADDFWDLHGKVDCDLVNAVVRVDKVLMDTD